MWTSSHMDNFFIDHIREKFAIGKEETQSSRYKYSPDKDRTFYSSEIVHSRKMYQS